MRRAIVAALATVALGCGGHQAPARPAPASAPPARFEIVAVADSTFDFAVGPQTWLRPGATGIAVDPRRRDGLVARYRVLSVRNGLVTALITGQTTRLTADHMVLAVKPAVPLLRRREFWVGAFAGGLLGGLAGTASW